MIVFVKIDSTTGNGLGPNFAVTSNFGFVSPALITRQELLDGFHFNVNNSATKIILTSQGNCTNSFEIDIINIPPTTTTTTKSCEFTGGGSAFFVSALPLTTTSTTTIALTTTTTSVSLTTTSTTLAPTTTSTTQSVTPTTTQLVIPTTTSTTTVAPGPPIGSISIWPDTVGGLVGFVVTKQSGINPNTLTFNFTATQYNNAGCINVANTYTSSITLPANTSNYTDVSTSLDPSITRLRITSLTVNGIAITNAFQNIVVGGNTYTIVGFGNCVTI